jgi:hypothetical protein
MMSGKLCSITASLLIGLMFLLPSSASCQQAQNPAKRVFREKLISVWEHQRSIDLTELTEDLGFNMVWSHDPAYHGQAWEETHMYHCLQVPGIDYVLAKIDRAVWGWTQEMSIRHARWIALLSQMHPGIIGMYLNDFYDEIEEGHRTEEQWREIIAAAKDINPDLLLFVPHYPHRQQERHKFDFDIDGVIVNLWGNRPELIARAGEHIETAIAMHTDRLIIAGLYCHAGMDGGRWLTREEYKNTLGLYVDLVNRGKIDGLRVFRAGQMLERPEYQEWTREVLSNLKR